MTSNGDRVRRRLGRPVFAPTPPRPGDGPPLAQRRAAVDCGWGRLVFGQTYPDSAAVAEALRGEQEGRRDIAFYVAEPHVVLSLGPQDFFLDPSHAYRLHLHHYRAAANQPRGFSIRPANADDAEGLSRVYARCRMLGYGADFVRQTGKRRELALLVAVDESGEILGCVTGVDHVEAFDDPDCGSSLWSLAVDPQVQVAGVGEALTRSLAERFAVRGRAWMDLSVMHDNVEAIALYEKLGFERIPAFCVKRKNPFNEPLFTGAPDGEAYNPYARIIIDEARRRGVAVEPLDPEGGFFRLSHGGRSVACRESLSELTSAVAMSRCDDKAVTRRVLTGVGLRMPRQAVATGGPEDAAFLARHGRIVVKPARGEQGQGVAVDLRTPEEVAEAVRRAQAMNPVVLLEEMVEGEDLRIVVIGHAVVAAAIRRPAQVVGDGRSAIRKLIETQSRRRAAATGGESRIPLDGETERCVRAAGHALDEVLPEGATLQVRKSANLHTGGTIHDVTERLHPTLAEAAVRASRALEIPLVGLDMIVEAPDRDVYAIIEANERPGLANHEPQPTTERFLDLLFPETARS